MPNKFNTIRLFVSSTFRDFENERNALQNRVFPSLHARCEQSGLGFQVIDLRWGISEEASFTQQTMEICLQELSRCQETSLKPNFLMLLGNRSGWRPLPTWLKKSQFERLQAVFDPVTSKLFADWYVNDTNLVPEGYVLREVPTETRTEWSSAERNLRIAFDEAIPKNQPLFEELERVRCLASATEQEIYQGVVTIPDANDHVVAYLRQITAPASEWLPSYFDLKPDGSIDQAVQLQLKALKTSVRDQVQQHLFNWEIDGANMRPDYLSSSEYLNQFCSKVEQHLLKVIEDQISQLKEIEQQEHEAHSVFADERTKVFIGREDILHRVLDHVRGTNSSPFVIYGRSGAGKSALIARVFGEVSRLYPYANAIVRFIGATSNSSDIRSLLRDLSVNIGHMYGQTMANSDEYSELIQSFHSSLAFATVERPLFLFLDALDQLSNTEQARNLAWLPIQLPAHTYIIASTLIQAPDSPDKTPNALLQLLQTRLPPGNVIELAPMPITESLSLLDKWLSDAKRTLTEQQRKLVLNAFEHNGIPLYLKLVFEEVRHWRSEDSLSSLRNETEDMVLQLLDRLSMKKNHGDILVKRALSYLVSAKNGLTETELLGLLSSDNAVMDDFHRRSPLSPETKSFPQIIWSRLYFDLAPYLTQRLADGTAVLAFYHRQIREVVEKTFLGDSEYRLSIHTALADYFAKELKRNKSSRRALSELPYHLAYARQWAELGSLLSDLGFLQNKAIAGMSYDVLRDFELAQQYLPAKDYREPEALNFARKAIIECAQAYRQEFYALHNLPAITFQQLFNNLIARHGYEGEVGKVLRAALMDEAADKSHWLRRLNRSLHKKEEQPLVLALVTDHGEITALAISPDGDKVATGGKDGMVRIWAYPDGALLSAFKCHDAALTALTWLPDSALHESIVTGGRDRRICIWDWRMQSLVTGWAMPMVVARSIQVSPDGDSVITCSDERLVQIWNWRTGQVVKALRGHQGRVLCMALSQTGNMLVSGDENRTLIRWNAQSWQNIGPLYGPTDAVRCISIHPEGKLAASGGDDSLVLLWNLASGETLQAFKGHESRVNCVAMATAQIDGKPQLLLVSGSDDEQLIVWDTRLGLVSETVQAHLGGVTVLACSTDGKWIASGGRDGILRFWNPAAFRQNKRGSKKGMDAIQSIALHDGHTLITGSNDSNVRIWSLQSLQAHEVRERASEENEPSLILRGHQAPITCLLRIDDDRIVSGSADGTVRIWSFQRQQSLRVLGRPLSGRDQIETARPVLRKLLQGSMAIGHTAPVTHVVRFDSTSLISIGRDRTLRRWNLDTGAEMIVFQGLFGIPSGLAASSHLNLVAATTTAEEVYLWDGNGTKLESLRKHTSRVIGMVTLANDSLVTGSLDGTVCLWSLAQRRLLHFFADHHDQMTCLTALPDGSTIYTASQDSYVRAWDVRTGSCRILAGHTAAVGLLALDAETKRLYSYGADQRLFVWDLTRQSADAQALFTESISCITPLPEGRVGLGTRNGDILILKVSN